ncbi:MAG TPA: DUF3151 domain-containing protein [Actinomycetales bacterium]|nr:DUF3151 domain-containing protein [Actinomycetales bacterium]
MTPDNLLPGPAPTYLPEEPHATVVAALREGSTASELAARHPSSSLPWAVLAEQALDGVDDEADDDDRRAVVRAYAFARTGYHRGLDSLRRSGWKGHGPVPWSHEPNQGFLRALDALRRAAALIGEDDEAQRCKQFLDDCDPAAAGRLR